MHKGPEGGREVARHEHHGTPWKTQGILLLLATAARLHMVLCPNAPPRTCWGSYQRLFIPRAPLLSSAPESSMLEGCLGSPKYCLKKKQPNLGRVREEGWLPGDVADTRTGGGEGELQLAHQGGRGMQESTFPTREQARQTAFSYITGNTEHNCAINLKVLTK